MTLFLSWPAARRGAAVFFATALISAMGIKVTRADLLGKSIRVTANFKMKYCKGLKCAVTEPYTSNHMLYISKDGRTIYDYSGTDTGEAFTSGQARVSGESRTTETVSGNRLIVVTENSWSKTVFEFMAIGSKCKFTPKVYRKDTRSTAIMLKPTRCTVSEGNLFGRQ